MSKYLAAFALLLSLAFPAAAQVTGTDVSNTRHVVQSGDSDDEGLLPFTMSTPYGEAVLLVHKSGWAFIAIPSIGWSAHGLLAAMPLPPGMENATVSGGMCKITIAQDGNGGYVSVITPIVGGQGMPDASLTQAVADYKKQVKEAGTSAIPCGPTQG